MTLEQAEAILTELPSLHVRMDGEAHIGGLNRTIGRRFIDEIGAIDSPRIAETGSGLSTQRYLELQEDAAENA